MAKLLSTVSSGFDLIAEGWHPIAVTDAAWVPVRSGANKGKPRLSITYVITGGPSENRKLFDGGMFEGDGVRFTRLKLEALAPSVDWGDWEFPAGFDDAGAIEALRDALIAAEGYALVGHQEYNGERTERVRRVAPADADPQLAYDRDEDDGEY